MNNIEKKVGLKQMDHEIKAKSKYSKFKKIIQNLNAINDISSPNNQDFKKNNKNKRLILPELNLKDFHIFLEYYNRFKILVN